MKHLLYFLFQLLCWPQMGFSQTAAPAREAKVIQLVKFKTRLRPAEVRQIMEERAPRFRALPGLVQKYYTYEEKTGEYAGIYLWESEEAMRAFLQTDLAKTTASAYQVEGTPRVEFLQLLFPLREGLAGPAGEKPVK